MTRTPATTLLALVLLTFGLSGCGGSDDSGADAPKSDTSATADTGDAAGDEAPSTPPVFTDGPGDETLTFSGGKDDLGQGEFDQSELTISVGQTVEFVSGDGGTYGVKVGGLDGVTVTGGLKEYYRFDAAGTYPVEEDISGATAKIVVQ